MFSSRIRFKLSRFKQCFANSSGAAYAHAEKPLQEFVERCKLPFLPTPMGKGVISDEHSLCVAAARSRLN